MCVKCNDDHFSFGIICFEKRGAMHCHHTRWITIDGGLTFLKYCFLTQDMHVTNYVILLEYINLKMTSIGLNTKTLQML